MQSLKCTFESETPCPNDAIRAFRWPWGKTGVTCAEHMPHLQVLADQLQRPIEFSDAFDAGALPAGPIEERSPRFANVSSMAELDAALDTVMGEIRAAWHAVEDLESAHARLSDQAARLKEQLASVQTTKARPFGAAPSTTVVDGSNEVGLESSNDISEPEDEGPKTPLSGREGGDVIADHVVETSRETPEKNR